MAEIFLFKSKLENDAEQNLLDFIHKCKFDLTVFGEDLDWENWNWPGAANFTKVGVNAREKRDDKNILDNQFIDFAKAYFRYQQGHKPTGGKNELKALRAIEASFIQQGITANIQNLTIPILDNAAQIMTENYSGGSDYHGGREIERLAKFVTKNKLIVSDLSGWRNPIKRKADDIQTGAKARERRENKLPSEEALMALAEIFASNPSDPKDIFTTSTFALTMCAPSRITEILELPLNCEFEEKNTKGGIRYGWRFYAGKGYEGDIKDIVTEMVPIAKEAIKRITELTADSRKLALWVESNPDKFYRHSTCPDVSEDHLLSMKEACLALGLVCETPKQCGASLKNFNLEQKDGVHTLKSLWQYVMSRQPKNFPWLNKEKKIKYSDALFCMRRNMIGTNRGVSPVILWAPTNNIFNNDLSPRTSLGPENNTHQSIFDRYGYYTSDGSRIKLTSHQARHLLNTIAQRGGLSQLQIAKWSGRADAKQNRTYNHMSEFEMVAKSEMLNTSITLLGLSGEVGKHIPISLQEFDILEKGAVHITEFGICVHNFVMNPCEKYRDCLNCCEQVCIKGDEEKYSRIKARMNEVELQYQAAEAAMQNGDAGADRWYEYHKLTLSRIKELISILDNPRIENGAQIKLRNKNSFSPLRRAVEFKQSENKLNSPAEKKLLDDMQLLLGGLLG